MTAALKLRFRTGTRALCAQSGLPASTLRRWRQRAAQGAALLKKPGPKKPGPLPIDEVAREIESLRHAKKRSRGTGALYRRFRSALSRRDLGRWVQAQRQFVTARERASYRRVRWHQPNLAWAIDATEYGKDHQGRRLYLIVVIDLASRFTFAPLATLDPAGEAVAAYLGELFHHHGRPLLLKRDNGSIFNHHTVDQLLAGQAVIPLNSPAYYPPYNGGVEKGIRDLKSSLHDCLPQAPDSWQPSAITPFLRAAAHLRNCTRRRSLAGATAAQRYHASPPARFTARQRHDTFLWIKDHSAAILSTVHIPNRHDAAAAWRFAVQLRLQAQNLITIQTRNSTRINQPVLPHFHLTLRS